MVMAVVVRSKLMRNLRVGKSVRRADQNLLLGGRERASRRLVGEHVRDGGGRPVRLDLRPGDREDAVILFQRRPWKEAQRRARREAAMLREAAAHEHGGPVRRYLLQDARQPVAAMPLQQGLLGKAQERVGLGIGEIVRALQPENRNERKAVSGVGFSDLLISQESGVFSSKLTFQQDEFDVRRWRGEEAVRANFADEPRQAEGGKLGFRAVCADVFDHDAGQRLLRNQALKEVREARRERPETG